MIERWRRLSWRNRGLLCEALVCVVVASILIRSAPFRWVMRTANAVRHNAASGPEALREARRIRWAVLTAALYVPWRAVCFQRGLAAHWMMRRRGIASVFRYGVGTGAAGQLQAHVWITVGPDAILGDLEAPQFTQMLALPAAAPDRYRPA